ncbi:MAG: prepilin peptidase [Planctomycetota bacterium]
MSGLSSPSALPPSSWWRMLGSRPPTTRLPEGLDVAWEASAAALVAALPRTGRYLKRAERVLKLADDIEPLGESALGEALLDMRAVFRRGRQTSDDVLRGFALVREAAYRAIGLKAYPTQVAAALAMHDGCIAEVATGEGKTLIATMPATVAGWSGRGCHVITVNDYLAKRDADLMRPVYEACGLTVASVTSEDAPPARRAGYAADVTYTTNKDAAADYLRDKLTLGPQRGLTDTMLNQLLAGDGLGGSRSGGAADRVVMRGLEHVIADEADSVLIDEAVTPLIISGITPNAQQVEAFIQAAELAPQFETRRDFTINRQFRDVRLTGRGRNKVAEVTRPLGGIWAGQRRAEEMIVQAITARELYVAGIQYVVQDNKVVIVDESTGRLMPDREWRDGLHQAVSAKERVEVEPPKATMARVSFQRFFRMYRNLSGMTGTAWEERRELWQTYRTPVVRIPTHRPILRRLAPDRIRSTEDDKWNAVTDEVQRLNTNGRPILVGTRSVGASETLSERLTQRGVVHTVLNAVRHAEEAEVVAAAGQKGQVTIATNMAGRGTDVKLGAGVAELGGLQIIATERHDSRRVDRQLFGRAGRQGDPGDAVMFLSLEDELIQRYGRFRWLPWFFKRAQRRAQARARGMRKQVLKQDEKTADSLGFAGVE